MNDMRRRAAIVAAGLTLLVSGCAASGSDKAGGPGEPVVLKLATVNGDLAFTPQVQAFVDAVEELSDGELRIEIVYQVGDFQPDSEKQVVEGVAGGDYDLGVVGTQVFDTLGVDDFQALTAPMLIDSYALQDAVVSSPVAGTMMSSLDDLGVEGLAMLAGTLRRPVAVEASLGGPDDWAGITFSTFDSELQFDSVRALGAKPVAVVGDARDQALKEGTLDGFESSALAYSLNGQQATAPYFTTNVTLWPQTLAVVADPGLDARLSDEQRGWLDAAAEQAADGSALPDAEAKAIEDSCAAGARLWQAPQADLAELQAAFAPVYDRLRRDPETASLLDQITELKQRTPSEPDVEIPSDCGGAQQSGGEEASGTAPRYLNGVYRYTLTHEDAVAAGQGDDPEYPTTQTWWLENGRWEGSGDSSGTYWVNDDEITIQWDDTEAPAYSYQFSRDDDGNLTLTPAQPMDPADAFLMSGKPWIKIG